MKKKIIMFLLDLVINWKKYKSRILDIVKDTRISAFPMWLLYSPRKYKVTGDCIMQIQKVIQPGDIILKGTGNRLWDRLVPNKYGYTHAGIYVGDYVVHAMPKCVSKKHLIDFLQCDRVCVLRCAKAQNAVSRANHFMGIPYDYFFGKGQQALYSFQLVAACYRHFDFGAQPVKIFSFTLPAFCGSYYNDQSFIDSPYCKVVYEY